MASSGAPGAGRFIPIGVKFAFVSVTVIGATTSIAFFQATEREGQRLIEAKRTAAAMVADLLSQSLQAPLDFGDEDAARIEIDHLKQNGEVAYAGVWAAGSTSPMVELRGSGKTFPLPADRDTPRTLALSDRVETVRTIFGRDQKPIGSALIQFSLARENTELAVARRNILSYCVALALGTMLVLIAATRRQIVRPIEMLLDAARRTEKGERGALVQVRAHDEIGRLARAFNSMNAAIFDREERLATAHNSLRELFDHMRQGIVVIAPNGNVEALHSKAAAEILGGDALEGRPARALLYPAVGHWDAERRAFEEWLALAFEAAPEQWAEIAELAPRRLTLHAGTERARELALEFRPIAHEGTVARIMLLATDETDRRRLEREMALQGERHKVQLAAMRRLVAGGGQQFVSFIQRARRRLERASALVTESGERMSIPSITELFQIVHTLRGEAQALELGELAAVLSSVEDKLAPLRPPKAQPYSLAVRSELDEALASANVLLLESEEQFVAASPIGRAALDNVVVRRSDVDRLAKLGGDRGDEIGGAIRQLVSRPFGECVSTLLEQASVWADKENKRVRIDVEGRETPVPPALAEVLGGAITHMVRNAIAHGIETVDERMALSKPAVGVIRLECQRSDSSGVRVSVDDDGRGVSNEALLAHVSQRSGVLNQLGHASLTSLPQVTEIAGHGVGLSAVVADLSRVGYVLSVAARPGGGSRFEIRPGAGTTS